MHFRLSFRDGAASGRRFSVYSVALVLGGLVAVSCGGAAFSGDDDGSEPQTGGTSGGTGSGGTSGGTGSGGASGGQSSGGEAGATGGAGGDTSIPEGGAGPSGEAGAGGAWNGTDCEALDGQEFEGHCYVDATVESVIQSEAVATCSELASQLERPGHLLVLDSSAEQEFILKQFLVEYTDESDAWLALTCHELDQPDINACYCTECSEAELLEKQQTWKWLDGSTATFGWINGNPNQDYRCAALGYNPTTTIWGWVDRDCNKTETAPTGQAPHGYRTICELEP
jgi:hypothetical protein